MKHDRAVAVASLRNASLAFLVLTLTAACRAEVSSVSAAATPTTTSATATPVPVETAVPEADLVLFPNVIPSEGGEIHSRALQEPGGSIVVGASHFPYDEARKADIAVFIARVTPAGTLDTTFGQAGTARLARKGDVLFRNLAMQPDGKLLVAAAATGGRLIAIRLLRDGSVDRSFGNGGWSETRVPKDLAEKPGPRFPTVVPWERWVGWTVPTAIAALPDGKVILGGYDAQEGLVLLRLTRTGAVDTGFGAKGIVRFRVPAWGGEANYYTQVQEIVSITSGSAGTLSVATRGFQQHDEGGSEERTDADFRFLANGKPDLSFGTNGSVVVNGYVPRAEGEPDDVFHLADGVRFARTGLEFRRIKGSP